MLLFLCGSSFSAQAGLQFSTKRPIPSFYRSVSRQFIIYGTQKDAIPYILRRVDCLANRWNQFFQFPSIPYQPIIIRLLENPTGEHQGLQTNVFLDDANNVKIQLDIFDLREVGNLEFDRRIFYAFVLQYAYAAAVPALGSEYAPPPYWVIEAIMQNVLDAEESDWARPAAATKAIARTQNLDLKSFLIENPWQRDALSQAIYRMKASALLKSLVELPEGMSGMHCFLSQSSAWDGTISSLLACFPQLRADVPMFLNIWKKNLIALTVARKSFPLPMEETMKRFNDILSISLPEEMKYPKSKVVFGVKVIPLLAAKNQYKPYLLSKIEDLLNLSFRANPLCRSLIDEYRTIIEVSLRYPHKNLNARIQAAEKLREILSKRYSDIEDYVSGVETASSVDTLSSFHTILEHDQRRNVPTWRSDVISRILNAAEAAP